MTEDHRTGMVPAWCPICEETMKGDVSNKTYYKWGCCMHCHIEFVEDREEKWEAGWRPSIEEVARKRGYPIWRIPANAPELKSGS